MSSLCTDYSKFRLHTNATTRQFLAFLDAQQDTASKAHFEALETALGFNLRVHGLLMDDIIGHKVPEAIMFDFFHIYLVHGIVGNELGFFGKLRDAGFREDRMLAFVSSFRWPKQFASADAKRIFGKREKKTSPVKAEASELLNALPVLRVFVMMFVMKAGIDESTVQACMCFLMLCKVIDMLQAAVRGMVVDPAELHNTIVKHNNCLLDMEALGFKPKPPRTTRRGRTPITRPEPEPLGALNPEGFRVVDLRVSGLGWLGGCSRRCGKARGGVPRRWCVTRGWLPRCSV